MRRMQRLRLSRQPTRPKVKRSVLGPKIGATWYLMPKALPMMLRRRRGGRKMQRMRLRALPTNDEIYP